LDWKEVIDCMPLTDLELSVIGDKERWGLTVIMTEGQDKSVSSLSSSAAAAAKTMATSNEQKLWNVYLYNVLTEDDYEDEECLEETREDIKLIAEKYGSIHGLRIKCAATGNDELANSDGNGDADFQKREVCISYANEDAATRAVRGLNGMIIGGVPIIATFATQHLVVDSQVIIDESTLILDNILTEDDFEDEECQEETKADIINFAKKYGHIRDIKLLIEGDRKGEIVIEYDGLETASIAVKELNGMLIAGQPIIARQLNHEHGKCSSASLTNDHVMSESTRMNSSSPPDNNRKKDPVLILENILTEDDFEDEECREETMSDISDLVGKYGRIADLKLQLEGDRKGQVLVRYSGDETGTILSNAVNEMNRMIIGGQQILARRQGEVNTVPSTNNPSSTVTSSYPLSGAIDDVVTNREEKSNDPEPLFSGGKKIPEQYAVCKRVPKIPTPAIPREYASKIGDEAIPLLLDMLGELMRLQKRSKDDKNARARRRLVMGLREVARGIRARKIKMVVMANNLDMYGAIDSKLQEILDLAREENVPVFFELNKRKLGKALGKSIKVAVVGIQSSDGAYDPFKKLKKLANC